jgi:hypothetical protein
MEFGDFQKRSRSAGPAIKAATQEIDAYGKKGQWQKALSLGDGWMDGSMGPVFSLFGNGNITCEKIGEF